MSGQQGTVRADMGPSLGSDFRSDGGEGDGEVVTIHP